MAIITNINHGNHYKKRVRLQYFLSYFSYQMAAPQCPAHKFPHPSFCYHYLQDIKNYDFEVMQNGTNCIPNSIQLDRQTIGQTRPTHVVFSPLNLFKEHIIFQLRALQMKEKYHRYFKFRPKDCFLIFYILRVIQYY